MSLKTFHIAFISCSVLLAFGAGLFFLVQSAAVLLGSASLLLGALLVAYEVRFVKKLKHVRAL